MYHKHGAHLRISFWHLLMNFEKPKKSEFPKNEKKKKHKKAKKTGDIIILHMCTKNHNQVQSMRYGVTQFFCHLGPICGPPLSLTPQKTKILKKKTKKHLEIWWYHHFQLVQQKTLSNDVCLLRYGVWQTVFCHFRSFFALLPHYWPGKLKFGKM